MLRYQPICKVLPLTDKLKKWITCNAKKIIFEDNKTEYQIDRELEETNKFIGVEFWKYNQNKDKTKVRITTYKKFYDLQKV